MPVAPKDFVAAGSPIIASLTLGQINQVTGIIGGTLGIAYLIWKWRKESKTP